PPPASPVSADAPSTPVIYTLSLHDALPISLPATLLQKPSLRGRSLIINNVVRFNRFIAVNFAISVHILRDCQHQRTRIREVIDGDRKSTRLNSSHVSSSYAVFCLKKKKIVH